MLKQLLIIMLCFLSVSAVTAQVDTIPIRLSGRVFSSDSMQPAPYVHVINLTTGKGTVANQDGSFKTLAFEGDSLLFKCMGFDDAVFLIPTNLPSKIAHFDIKIVPGSIQLQVIDVIALTRQNQFKYDFVHLQPDKSAWEDQLIIPGVSRKQYEWVRKEEKYNPKASFNGPVSALYYAFSQEGKSLRKLATLLEYDEKRSIIDSKYNINILADFTGYNGDKLRDFFVYLHLSDDYILNTNLYAIYADISREITIFEAEYQKKP